MTLEQARNILINFNRLRRCEDVEPMLPSDIGKAIDVAIDYLSNELKTKQDENTNNI